MIFITRGYTELAKDKAVISAMDIHFRRISKFYEAKYFWPRGVDSENRIIAKQYGSILELALLIFLDKERRYFTSEFLSVLIVKLFSPLSKVTYWVQGSIPDESYMRNKSKIRYYVSSALEFVGLTLSNEHIFVSDAMRSFYYRKYPILDFIKKRHCIVPCSSRLSYQSCDKIKDSYLYLGGMDPWQSFDKICDIFNEINSFKPNAVFSIITRDKEKALKTLNLKNVKNFKVITINDSLNLSKEISKYEYGFLIRDDSNVNKVASPIKLGEYLSCGVRPIITSVVSAFEEINSTEVCIVIPFCSKQGEIISIINSVCHVNVESVLELYQGIYSEDMIIKRMSNIFQ
ncbi:hypothetical protein [Vibrio cholerae]|uniref:hypothetical protein n=1 Tax=Vibrio cholerae TaxID=666 RepID=UPI0028BB930B|nr:hypothetical protein [Vibrio cholerae]HDZ3778604.1 hypothetical protein [Vibrio cholerae]